MEENQDTTPTTSMTVVQEEKILSPEEQADLEKKRALFRSFHDLMADQDIYEAESVLGVITGAVTEEFDRLQDETKMNVLKVKSDNELITKFMELFTDSTVREALVYTTAMNNAVQQHKYIKTKEWTVGDLDIKLL